MTLYQKVIAVFSTLKGIMDGKADSRDIAPDFSDETQYAPKDLVMRNNILYRCTEAHIGPWNAGHFRSGSIDGIMPKKVSDLENDKGFVGSQDISRQFGSMSLSDNATQEQIREAVQAMIAGLKALAPATSATVMAAMVAASAFGMMPSDTTKWEGVDPTNIVKDIVVKFSPAPDLSSGNTQLVNTIRSESMTTNSQSFLVGLMNNMATSVYDSGTIVLKDHEINCVNQPYNVSFELPPPVPGRSCSFGIFMAHSPQNTFTFPTNGVAYLNPGMIWPFEPPSGDYLRYSFAMFYEIYCPDLETRSFVLLGGECYRVPVSEGQGR